MSREQMEAAELAARIRRALDEGTFADFRARYSGNLEKRA